jgi:hypothetical protein
VSAYCTPANVYEWLPRGSVSAQPLLVASVDVSANTFTINGHGLADDDALTFRAEAGGSLPSPLVAGTTYYANVSSDSVFSVSASCGGADVNLTTAGENVVAVVALPWSRWIESASAEVEQLLPAHCVPLDAPYPEPVISYTAGLVAGKALSFCGVSSASIEAGLERVRRELDTWRKNVPLRGAIVPPSANQAVRATTTNTDPRGWCNPLGDRYIP